MSCALLENYIEVCYIRRPRVCCLGATTTTASAKTDENVVCYTAVFSVVTQRFSPQSEWGGALRDDTRNDCVAD